MAPKLRSAPKSFFDRHDNVFLYVANLIGYCRVLLAGGAFAVALEQPGLCFSLYALSFVCDELDGRFARMFNQTSTFGAVLDMVTDRVATSCLLATLSVLYPKYHAVFLALLMLDIFSHWFQMYATLALGDTTHKDSNSKSFLVRLYYKHRIFMGLCCVCVEVLYLILYLLAFDTYHSWGKVAIPQWADIHNKGYKEAPLLCVLAGLVLPGFLVKQIVNVAQLRTAAGQLATLDTRKGRK